MLAHLSLCGALRGFEGSHRITLDVRLLDDPPESLYCRSLTVAANVREANIAVWNKPCLIEAA